MLSMLCSSALKERTQALTSRQVVESAPRASAMTPADVEALLDRIFPESHGAVLGNGIAQSAATRDPQSAGPSRAYSVEAVWFGGCRVRMHFHAGVLRPGGTISGPAMFAVTDLALYVAVLSAVGPVGLAVTTQLTINFLRKPPAADLVAVCSLLKLGKSLAVGEVTLFSDGMGEPVCHATGTYSIPPDRAAL